MSSTPPPRGTKRKAGEDLTGTTPKRPAKPPRPPPSARSKTTASINALPRPPSDSNAGISNNDNNAEKPGFLKLASEKITQLLRGKARKKIPIGKLFLRSAQRTGDMTTQEECDRLLQSIHEIIATNRGLWEKCKGSVIEEPIATQKPTFEHSDTSRSESEESTESEDSNTIHSRKKRSKSVAYKERARIDRMSEAESSESDSSGSEDSKVVTFKADIRTKKIWCERIGFKVVHFAVIVNEARESRYLAIWTKAGQTRKQMRALPTEIPTRIKQDVYVKEQSGEGYILDYQISRELGAQHNRHSSVRTLKILKGHLLGVKQDLENLYEWHRAPAEWEQYLREILQKYGNQNEKSRDLSHPGYCRDDCELNHEIAHLPECLNCDCIAELHKFGPNTHYCPQLNKLGHNRGRFHIGNEDRVLLIRREVAGDHNYKGSFDLSNSDDRTNLRRFLEYVYSSTMFRMPRPESEEDSNIVTFNPGARTRKQVARKTTSRQVYLNIT